MKEKIRKSENVTYLEFRLRVAIDALREAADEMGKHPEGGIHPEELRGAASMIVSWIRDIK